MFLYPLQMPVIVLIKKLKCRPVANSVYVLIVHYAQLYFKSSMYIERLEMKKSTPFLENH